MSSVPTIGISCDYEVVTDRRGMPSPRFVLPASYVAAVVAAGGQPVVLPHHQAPPDGLLAKLDGLVISGGDFDIPPSYYGAAVHPSCGATLPQRSAFERALCQKALADGLPLLGICGGMQLMCVVLGGTLHQDLSERPHTRAHVQPQDKSQPFHRVHLQPRSLVAKAYEAQSIATNSTHHQVIDALGPQAQAVGQADDGVIEAIEIAEHPFALGLQWHPEAMFAGAPPHLAHLGPYRLLVGAARSYRRRA